MSKSERKVNMETEIVRGDIQAQEIQLRILAGLEQDLQPEKFGKF